jgi:hypothetical protein
MIFWKMTVLLLYSLLHTGNFTELSCPSAMNILLHVCDDHIQNVTMGTGGKVACHGEDWHTCLAIPVLSYNMLHNP